MTGTSILTQNVTTFIKNSVNFENIFCQRWSPLGISAKLPLSSQPLTLQSCFARSFLFPSSRKHARLPDCPDAWLLGCLAARLPGCPDARMRDGLAAWLLGCSAARLLDCLIARMPGCPAAWLPDCPAARMKCAESGIFKIKNRKCHPVQGDQGSFG